MQITIPQIPNHSKQSNHATIGTLTLQLPNIPISAKTAYHVQTSTVSSLCNAYCKVMFGKHMVPIKYNGQTVIQRWQDPQNGLWCIPISNMENMSPPPKPQNHILYTQHIIDTIYDCSEARELHQLHHVAFFSQTKAA